MKRMFTVVALSLALFSLMGCAFTRPLAVTSNPIGRKVGESSITLLFNFIPLSNDAGIYAAARKGGITTISTVDVRETWWLFGTTTTTVITGD
ncbi:MAG: hypothetical protein M0001_05425 [Treponema sp.]|nr:hypothetical protein [Treponema sp.]